MVSLFLIVSLVGWANGFDIPLTIDKPLPPIFNIMSPNNDPVSTTPFIGHQQRVVCYFGTGNITNIINIDISELNHQFCTHVIISSIVIGPNGNITIQNVSGEPLLHLMNKLSELRSRRIKILWSWRGWINNMEALTNITRVPQSRDELIYSIVTWIMQNGDGFDLDLAYPRIPNVDILNQLSFIRLLKTALNGKGLLLTMAASSNAEIIRRAYRVPKLIEHLDWINVKSNDTNVSGTNSSLIDPLYTLPNNADNVKTIVQLYLALGVPADLLVLGVPLSGLQYNLTNSNQTLPGSAVTGLPRILPYNEICLLLNQDQWNLRWSDISRTDWAFRNREWLTWISIRAIAERAQFVQTFKLGGLALWDIEFDDHRGSCGPTWPLLKSIRSIFYEDAFPIRPPSQTSIGECNVFGYAPDLLHKSRFYRCVPSEKGIQFIPFVCPDCLVFNSITSICEWSKQH